MIGLSTVLSELSVLCFIATIKILERLSNNSFLKHLSDFRSIDLLSRELQFLGNSGQYSS